VHAADCGDAPGTVGDAVSADCARSRVRGDIRQSAADGVRHCDDEALAASTGADSSVPAPGYRAPARAVHTALSRGMVPSGSATDRVTMRLEDFQLELAQLACAMPVCHGRVDAAQWRRACE